MFFTQQYEAIACEQSVTRTCMQTFSCTTGLLLDTERLQLDFQFSAAIKWRINYTVSHAVGL